MSPDDIILREPVCGTWSDDDEKWAELYIQTYDDDLQVQSIEFVKYRKKEDEI